MVGTLRGFACLVKKKRISWCCHNTLLSAGFKSSRRRNEKFLDGATKMVSFIKQKSVHSRIFKKLCENLDKEHINLLLHAEILCLSRIRDLNRVSELKGELQE
jgi:hypothetical protein